MCSSQLSIYATCRARATIKRRRIKIFRILKESLHCRFSIELHAALCLSSRMKTAQKLSELRFAAGLTRRELAEMAHLDVTTIVRLESRGTAFSAAGTLQKIAAVLEVYPRALQSQSDINRRGVIEPIMVPLVFPFTNLFDNPEDCDDF